MSSPFNQLPSFYSQKIFPSFSNKRAVEENNVPLPACIFLSERAAFPSTLSTSQAEVQEVNRSLNNLQIPPLSLASLQALCAHLNSPWLKNKTIKKEQKSTALLLFATATKSALRMQSKMSSNSRIWWPHPPLPWYFYANLNKRSSKRTKRSLLSTTSITADENKLMTQSPTRTRPNGYLPSQTSLTSCPKGWCKPSILGKTKNQRTQILSTRPHLELKSSCWTCVFPWNLIRWFYRDQFFSFFIKDFKGKILHSFNQHNRPNPLSSFPKSFKLEEWLSMFTTRFKRSRYYYYYFKLQNSRQDNETPLRHHQCPKRITKDRLFLSLGKKSSKTTSLQSPHKIGSQSPDRSK